MIESWSPDDHVIRWRAIHHKEVKLFGELQGVRTYRDHQCHYSSKVHPIFAEIDEGSFKQSQPFRIHLQLLESWEVNNVSRAAIVDKNPSGVESFYHKHDD